jgi:hypothetical protein
MIGAAHFRRRAPLGTSAPPVVRHYCASRADDNVYGPAEMAKIGPRGRTAHEQGAARHAAVAADAALLAVKTFIQEIVTALADGRSCAADAPVLASRRSHWRREGDASIHRKLIWRGVVLSSPQDAEGQRLRVDNARDP